MPTLLELYEGRLENLENELDEIEQRAADEERDLNDDELARTAELRSSIEAAEARIAEQRADAERRAARAESTPPPETRPRPRRSGSSSSRHEPIVQVRSEPLTYGGRTGMRHFLRDLLRSTHFGSQLDDEGRARMERHQDEVRSEWVGDDDLRQATLDKLIGVAYPWPSMATYASPQERQVNTGDLGGVVNPVYDPAHISRGIYPSGVTARLLRRYPMTEEGMSVIWPRVTTRASAAVQAGEGAAFHEADLEAAEVVVPVFTVAARLPLSIQAVERGAMAVELVQDEMMRAHMDSLNANVLFGNANAGGSTQPAGILWQGAGKTVTEIDWDVADAQKAQRTVLALSDQINAVIDALWQALLMAPDAIVLGPTVWGKLRTWRDKNDRPLFGLSVAVGRNVIGVADRVPMSEGPEMVGDFFGIPIYVDAWITNTFTPTSSATTGGKETRIIVMQRDSVPVAYDGPMSFTFEQTLAGEGKVLLVCRGYAAFNAAWRPEGIRVLGGSGTAVDAPVSSMLDAPQAPQLDAKELLASLPKKDRDALLKQAADQLAAAAAHEAAAAAEQAADETPAG